MYQMLASENCNCPLFSMRHQKLTKNSWQKIYQVLQVNVVAAVETIY